MDLIVKSRAVKHIGQLNDGELFNFISEGMDHIIENVLSIEADVGQLLDSGRIRGARILRLFAEEEAGKFLVLLDLVRSLRSSCDFSRQLKHFYDHLAKRIYVWSCISNQNYFSTVKSTIDFFRKESYINPITVNSLQDKEQLPDEREGILYIDCFEEDGKLDWITPNHIDKIYQRIGLPDSNVILLVGALFYAGFTKPSSLKKIASRWRLIQMYDEYSRVELDRDINATVDDLKRAGLHPPNVEQYLTVIKQFWFFPLHSLKLCKMTVKEFGSVKHPIIHDCSI